MLGDIRLATLANSTVDGSSGATMHDRSVKGNNMTEQGSVLQAAVATDAELQYYTNFGSSNYLSRGYSGNFNFTNTMSVMFWVKDYQHSKDIYGLGTRSSTLSQSIYVDGGYDYRFTLTSDGSTEQQFEIPESETLDEWTFICFSVNAGAVRGYKNGQNVAASNGTFTGNIFSQASANEGLEIGKGAIASTGSSSGKLALFRISATAPTPQQVKDIYEAEKPLFRAGAKCLLQQLGNTDVNDLSYDKTTDLLTVSGTNSANGSTTFRGLEAVDTFDGQDHSDWSGGSITTVASAGGIRAYNRPFGTGGVIVDLPAIDVRGDINTADSKLPDDGKLHFTGVTTNATPTVIGNIPIAEDEHLYIKSVVNAGKYRAKTSERASFEVDAQFVRKIGDDVNAPTELRKLSDETYSQTFDVEFVRTTGGSDSPANIAASANNIMLKVTGVAGMRFEWSADITVQRISEKQYER